MLEGLRDRAKAALFTHSAVQQVLGRAVNLRADLLEQLDTRLAGLAKRLNLTTAKELKALQRQIRELENQVRNLEGQLGTERARADRAEGSLGEALKAAKKPGPEVHVAELEARVKAAEAKAEAEAKARAKAEATAKAETTARQLLAETAARQKSVTEAKSEVEGEDASDKVAGKKSPRTKKKGEDDAE